MDWLHKLLWPKNRLYNLVQWVILLRGYKPATTPMVEFILRMAHPYAKTMLAWA